MKLFLKLLASALLLFNGIGAIYGGWHLMMHPDGSSIQLSMDWLEHTPFKDYLIPGIVLFIANGLFSMVVLCALIFKFRHYAWYIMVQGAILTGWIVIQVLMVQTIYFLHIILGIVGLLLIIIGALLLNMKQ